VASGLLKQGAVAMRRFDPQPGPLKPLVHSLELKAILVVDDDRQLASALQWILADENFLVDVPSTARKR